MFSRILTVPVILAAVLTLLIAPRAGAQPDPVDVDASVSVERVRPGGEAVVAVTLDHDEGFHVYPNQPTIPEALGDFPAIATTITPDAPDALTLGRIQWPEEHVVEVNYTGVPADLPVYEGRAIAYVPIRVSPDAEPGELELAFDVRYQVCNDVSCFPPVTKTVSATLTIDPDAPVSKTDADLFADFDQSVYADPEAWGEQIASAGDESGGETHRRRFLGLFTLPPIDSAFGIAIIALTAMLGGFVLNLTPCVLPVIPIKVMAITKHAGEDPRRVITLGLWMALGVVAFWFGIGLPVAFVGGFVDPSIIFGVWWVTAAIGLVIGAMGLGIMGWFSINLPQKAYMINPKADTIPGSFLFGVMTAVLGLPCFGFVAGALLAGAATMAWWQVLTVFASLGIGMALPYLVLTLNPKWVNALPKTGPASDLVKQIMGLLMLAAAAYFLGSSALTISSGQGWALPWWGKAVHWWIIGAIGIGAAGWLIARTLVITKRPVPRVVIGAVGVIVGLGGAGAAASQTSHLYNNFWVPYTAESFEAALDSGQIVVLDFTAEWCLNCKTLEATVLSRRPVKPELLSGDVVPMAADLTSTGSTGWDKLNELGSQGIPLLAVFTPGQPEPVWQEGAYSGSQVVAAIEEARQRRDASAGSARTASNPPPPGP